MGANTHDIAEQDTNALIHEIRQLFLNAANKRTLQADMQKQDLLENCVDAELAGAIRSLTVISFHILDAIGRYGPINSTNISQKTGIPKGTVSKNISKLISYKLIVKNNIPGNKKESVFHLTAVGEELSALHAKMHERLENKILEFFKKYSKRELEFIVQFLNDYTNGI